jgi:hypothetical protein
MYPPDHFHTMTDAQLEQYDRLTRLVDRLTHELEEANNAAAAVETRAAEEVGQLRADLDRMCTTVLDLTTKHAGQQQANRRLCGEQVQLIRALRALVDAVGAIDTSPHAARLFPDVVKPWSEANELLSLVEVPFG